MARVHHRKARKDYPDHGISKGDMYYFSQIKTGARSSKILRSLTPFKRSQLTSSSYLSALYDWEDAKDAVRCSSDIEPLINDIRELGEEQYQSFENMPEGLQQGDTGQMLENRASECEAAADELEGIMSDWEDATTNPEDCTECNSTGIIVRNGGDMCDECNGSGIIEPEKTDDDFIDEVQNVCVDA